MKKTNQDKNVIKNPDYDYMGKLPLDGWQWEFVRRNEVYRNIYSEIEKCLNYKNGSPFKIPEKDQGYLYERWRSVQKQFHLRPFYEKKPYGVGFPDPNLSYVQLPNSIKPLMKWIAVAGQNSSPNLVRVFEGKNWEKEIRKVWHNGIDQLWGIDKRIAINYILELILAPGNLDDTILLGISLTAKRKDVKRQIEALIGQYLPARSQKGVPRLRPKEWNAYLQVWDEWEKRNLPGRKSFPEIASKLNIKLSTVKTNWYKTFEIIYREKYDPQKVKEENRGKAEELCAKCKDVTCYKDFCATVDHHAPLKWIPCPQYVRLGGKGSQRERTMSKSHFRLTHFGNLPEEEN